MFHTIPHLTYWESTDPVFVLYLGRAQKTLTEEEATCPLLTLGAFLRQPTATFGIDEYTVLEQWRHLKEKETVNGSMDVHQARDALYVALDGTFIDTTKEVERIDAYLIDLAHRHQGPTS